MVESVPFVLRNGPPGRCAVIAAPYKYSINWPESLMLNRSVGLGRSLKLKFPLSYLKPWAAQSSP